MKCDGAFISLLIEHVNFNLWKWNFDRFCLIDFSILSVNCSHVCIIYVKIYEKVSSGGLEVSLSIGLNSRSEQSVCLLDFKSNSVLSVNFTPKEVAAELPPLLVWIFTIFPT